MVLARKGWFIGVLCLVLAACSSLGESPEEKDEAVLSAQAVGVSLWTTQYRDALNWNTQAYYYETIQFPDINNDGKADVCGRSSNGLECSFGNGSSFGFFQSFYPNHFSNAQNWHIAPFYWKTIRYPDLNVRRFDNRDDVCGRDSLGIVCAVTNISGTGFGILRRWTTDFSNAQNWHMSPAYWSTIQFADVDGDGDDDVCGRGAAGIYCAKNKGTHFDPVTLWNDWFRDNLGWKANDYYYATIKFADVNGDGKADVCGRGGSGVYCGLSDGDKFEKIKVWTSQFRNGYNWHTSPSYWSTIQFADINDDGKADVCGRGGGGMYCGVSTGSKFIGAFGLNVPQLSDANNWNRAKYYETIRVVDVNGDGKADICGRGIAGIHCAHSTSTSSTVSFDPLYLRVNNFGDQSNWGSTPAYWKTVQPVNVDRQSGYEFCGRGGAGIYCSND